MAYCGCGTSSNRLKWAIAVIATLLGVGLIAGAIGKAASDLRSYDDCLKACLNSGKITNSQYEDNKDGPSWNDGNSDYGNTGIVCVDQCQEDKLKSNASAVGGMFWAGVAALVIASIPCYIMCCCTKRPDTMHGHAVAVPYSGSAPVATPYQAGQYQAAQPTAYAYPPSAGPNAAAPGYPQPAYNYGKV